MLERALERRCFIYIFVWPSNLGGKSVDGSNGGRWSQRACVPIVWTTLACRSMRKFKSKSSSSCPVGCNMWFATCKEVEIYLRIEKYSTTSTWIFYCWQYFEHSEVKEILQNGPRRKVNVDRYFVNPFSGELAAEDARNQERIRRYCHNPL